MKERIGVFPVSVIEKSFGIKFTFEGDRLFFPYPPL